MATAGQAEVANERIMREPFNAWLTERTTPIQGTRYDHGPGVVLVWRNSAGQPDHAAVTIGGGYAVTKPSQLGAVPGSSGPYRRPSLQVGSAASDSVAT